MTEEISMVIVFLYSLVKKTVKKRYKETMKTKRCFQFRPITIHSEAIKWGRKAVIRELFN